ncbi:hypothetical protein R3W88_019596 [Solanum pinnatisectum]|uniref:Uncharacterized protein n=1 Tax=Solanum pinnatisectum TaxID=50273 RepID=A0AAV9KM84_9SOLN|nr:hypothetical protein R3W88_019596 [Solanum pinnatisectum]
MWISEISFGSNFKVPITKEILHEWINIIKIDIGNGYWMTFWIRHSRLGTKIVTSQMEKIIQYLNNEGVEPSNVGTSSSLPSPA